MLFGVKTVFFFGVATFKQISVKVCWKGICHPPSSAWKDASRTVKAPLPFLSTHYVTVCPSDTKDKYPSQAALELPRSPTPGRLMMANGKHPIFGASFNQPEKVLLSSKKPTLTLLASLPRPRNAPQSSRPPSCSSGSHPIDWSKRRSWQGGMKTFSSDFQSRAFVHPRSWGFFASNKAAMIWKQSQNYCLKEIECNIYNEQVNKRHLQMNGGLCAENRNPLKPHGNTPPPKSATKSRRQAWGPGEQWLVQEDLFINSQVDS